ncbi:unnamed protein product [Bemisia tabaci]|uniref:39S ribosomal protein L53, mitochondrial n=1 Tax=Bemisia tabaci TaxID=7038 RepID=A0A9P0ABP3_BEMTA|nr:unnamed protein product [Bemisia tabaci]
MALPPTGVLHRRSGGIVAAIRKQVKILNLKPVKKIQFSFDPFGASESLRHFMHGVSIPAVRATNLNAVFRNEILSDRQEPTINISLVNGESVIFKCSNLTFVELLTLYNRHISRLAPKEVDEDDELTAKYTKKLAKKIKK